VRPFTVLSHEVLREVTCSRTSTRDASTWEGDVLRGEALADLDNDPRVASFIEQMASEIAPGKAPAYRYAAAISREGTHLATS
jgi:hypothetical protein